MSASTGLSCEESARLSNCILSFICRIALSCCFAASSFTSLGRPTSVTLTLNPCEARCRAVANPSPPFLPGPDMTCIRGLGLVAIRVAISREMFAPTASISWKWLTPRYSELSSATCISSLVTPASVGFVAMERYERTGSISGLGAWLSSKKEAWLDGRRGADGYSLGRHLVVVPSGGDRVLAHLHKSQSSAACEGSFSSLATFEI